MTATPIQVTVYNYRTQADYLFHVAGPDFMSCRGKEELADWKFSAERALSRALVMSCSRAQPQDHQRMNDGVAAVRARMEQL